MSKVEEFLSQIDALETLKKQAIEEVLLERQKLDSILAKLGYQADGRKHAKRERRPCRICGEMGHNAARHRAEKQGEEKPAPPPPAPRPEDEKAQASQGG